MSYSSIITLTAASNGPVSHPDQVFTRRASIYDSITCTDPPFSLSGVPDTIFVSGGAFAITTVDVIITHASNNGGLYAIALNYDPPPAANGFPSGTLQLQGRGSFPVININASPNPPVIGGGGGTTGTVVTSGGIAGGGSGSSGAGSSGNGLGVGCFNNIYWSANSLAITYTVQRSIYQLAGYINIAQGLTSNYYVDNTDPSLDGVTFYYKVVAIGAFGATSSAPFLIVTSCPLVNNSCDCVSFAPLNTAIDSAIAPLNTSVESPVALAQPCDTYKNLTTNC